MRQPHAQGILPKLPQHRTQACSDAHVNEDEDKGKGKNATHNTKTPIIASSQELYNITAIKPKAPNKLVVMVLILSTIPVDAVAGSDIYLEIMIPDELSSKNCGCM